jgi:acetylglutamate kinase
MLSQVQVVKIGGNELEDADWVVRMAAAFAALPGEKVLVHGGGREVTTLQRALGAEPVWHDGLRVTTPEALRAVRMVLSGSANKRLVSALLDRRVDAIGISGEDAALLRARPALGGALGLTGEIEDVRCDVLLRLLGAGFTPVVSPVARGCDGAPLNVNADDAAAAIASALGARALYFVSNVPALRNGMESVAEIGLEQVEPWVAAGIVADGMVPKLRAAARAVQSGVADVRIGDLAVFGDAAAGTRVRRVSRPVVST